MKDYRMSIKTITPVGKLYLLKLVDRADVEYYIEPFEIKGQGMPHNVDQSVVLGVRQTGFRDRVHLSDDPKLYKTGEEKPLGAVVSVKRVEA